MSGNHSEDEAWRSIVENYGERPQVEPMPEPADEPSGAAEPAAEPFLVDWDGPDQERYTPPLPPPLPLPAPARLAAWLGIFGAPALLLVATVAGVSLPSIVGLGLVAWFLGGFTYLVLTMDKGPRDPGDNGAQV